MTTPIASPLRSPFRSPLRSVISSALPGPPFDPTTLFGGSDDGGWYDPSDMSTLFQDSAATTPVTADGQPVGCIRDKSGKGQHLIQTTSGQRPAYRASAGLAWLEVGSGTCLQAAGSVNQKIPSYVGAAFLFVGATSGAIFGSVNSASGFGYQKLFRANLSLGAAIADAVGTFIRTVIATSAAQKYYADYQAETTSAGTLVLNGAPVSQTTTQTLTTMTNGKISINATVNNNSADANTFNFYGGLLITRGLTAPERASCKTFFGSKAGLSL